MSLRARWNRIGRAGILLALALVCGQPGWASAAPSGGISQAAFDIWPAEGWQQNAVTAIIQSHDGYLWLATYHGLVRFDGVRFTVFDVANTPSLQNGLITSLYEDSDEVLWVGHETGQLTRFAAGRFQSVRLGPTWRGGAIEGISSDEQGDLWLLNDGGFLFRLRDGLSVEVPGGASPTRKPVLVRAKDGRLWLVANGAVATLEQGKLVPFQFTDSAPTDFYERVLPARDGGLWVLGNDRVRHWRQGRWAAELDLGLHAPGGVTALLEMRSGALLAGTLRDGLYLLGPGGAETLHFNHTNGLSHDWVRSLCEDHEGNIWIGTGGGFDGLRPRKVQMLTGPDRWQGCAVLSFSVCADKSVWVGTEGAGLHHYSCDQWTSFGESSGLSNAFVWSVLETRRNELFVGTWGGGLVLQNSNRFECSGDLAKITEPVPSLYEGRQGELWVGTRAGLLRLERTGPPGGGDGLPRQEGWKLTWSAGKDKLALPDVRTITETADGTLWFGMHGGGLGSLIKGSLKQFRRADGLGSDNVNCLFPEADGTLWIGTEDNGLTRLKEGKFKVISTPQGLPSPIIFHMVDDGAGHLWLGSHAWLDSHPVIFRVDKADLDRCADGLTPAVHCLGYGKAEGLAAQSCSGGFQPGACRSSDGRLWFPTAKGLAVIDPANVSTNTAQPPVVIEELLVAGVRVDLPGSGENEGEWQAGSWGDDKASVGPSTRPASRLTSHGTAGQTKQAPLRIPPGRQRFEFHFTGLSFVAPHKVRFRHKLDGLEQDWSEPGTERVTPYGYLPPGDYTFHVIACNNDELWNETGASLAFTVLPYFWQTWWFQGTGMLSGASAVGLGVLWGTRRRLRRRLEQLERQRALERERARIARDIHDDLGASLTRIGMLSQSVRTEVETLPQAAADVDQIYRTAREMTRAMDEIVWAVNPKHDTLDSLVTYLGRFAQHYLSAASIRCRLDVPMHLPAWALTSEIRHNVFLAFKEALNNVVKHAQATEVRVWLEMLPGGFLLGVADNGRGFDWAALAARAGEPLDGAPLAGGNGVLNMRKRLEEIHGHCEWTTAPGEGTRVKLSVVFA